MFVWKSKYDTVVAERDLARDHAERLYDRLKATKIEREAAKEETRRVTAVHSDVIRSHRREIERLRVEVAGLRDQLAKFNTRGSDGRFVKRADRVQAA